MKPTQISLCCLLVVALCGDSLVAQTPAQGSQAPAAAAAANPLAQGQKLVSEGKLDDAVAFYNTALKTNPNSWEAYMGLGSALDLKGDYAAARQALQKAIELAPADNKVRPMRTMAVSYAFTSNAGEAAKYEEQALALQKAKGDFAGAAGTANELARIYLEDGDLKNAEKWYDAGNQLALQNPKLTDAEKDLWQFRLLNAQARIAARQGNKAKAEQLTAQAKALIAKGSNPDQAQFVPYLEGYVAFYGGDFAKAISDLQKANQKDPFILLLMAEAYEKSGDQKNAMDEYRKILEINSHSPTNAFARPIAQKKVGAAN